MKSSFEQIGAVLNILVGRNVQKLSVEVGMGIVVWGG